MKTYQLNSRFTLFMVICISLGCMLVAGCTTSAPTGASPSGTISGGAAAVTIRTGKIGVLAKSKMIEMEKLIIHINVKGIDSVVVTDTFDLSGYGETIASKTYPALSAPQDFTLNAQSLDTTGTAIHTGSVDFTTIPGDTVDVPLNLDARYSMLRVAFNDIPDSVSMVQLGIAGTDTIDYAFTVGSVDTVVLSYDYLAADSDGVEHAISLRASGSFYGKDTVLFAADTTILARSGVDSSYRVVLKWVGPGVPKGTATMTVTIGTVGTTLINAGFEGIAGKISSSQSNLCIGQQEGSPFFKDIIDDIRIYNRSLIANEILTLYHENGWTGNS